MSLPSKWTKASVIGSLWAANEIILGSFLHNLQIPFSGTILAFMSVSLLIAFTQVWKDKGMIFRAGLICAVMKSLSPSAVILGPMAGIMLEAISLEFSMLILGRNLAGYMVGGALAVTSVLFQKIIKLLILFGTDLVKVIYNFYLYLVSYIHLENTSPWLVAGMVIGIYTLAGILAALFGYYTGKKVDPVASANEVRTESLRGELFRNSKEENYNGWLLITHLAALIFILYILDPADLIWTVIPAFIYLLIASLRYRSSLIHLKKPVFWIQFVLITFLASVFWNGFTNGNLLDTEGILVGITMNIRAAVVLVAFSAISVELRNPLVKTILYDRGLKNFYLSLELAFASLPGIIASFPSSRQLINKPLSAISTTIRKATALLPAFEDQLENLPRIIIITGYRQEGKTALIKEVVQELKERKVIVKGFISEALHDDTGRTGYNIVNLDNGESKGLCHVKNTTSQSEKKGRFYFDAEGISFGKQILLSGGGSLPDIFVLDEVGPLEVGGGGWAPALDILSKEKRPLFLFAVRPRLVRKVILKWPVKDSIVFPASETNPETVVNQVLKWMSDKSENENQAVIMPSF